MMIRRATVIVGSVFVLAPSWVSATPSTTFWGPSTALCQGFGVPHVTYDTYFRKGPAAGSSGAPNYPIDTGLTVGVIPSGKIQAEVGFDFLLPSQDPFYLNGKLCAPENVLFKNAPGISVGFYNVGFKEDVNNYNVVHVMFQKSLPVGGYLAAGVYHGFNNVLFTNSDGERKKTGALIGGVTPDVQIGLKGLKKLNFAADIQTGKNVLGAWGFGSNVYFADNVSLLLGPVFFLDRNLQPGGSKWMFSAQLDIDINFGK